MQIAFLKSSKAELDFSVMMRKRAWITGSTLRPRTPEEKGVIARELLAHVWPLFENGHRGAGHSQGVSVRARPPRRTG